MPIVNGDTQVFDRRISEPATVGSYTPGIRRVETAAIDALRTHDEEFANCNDPALQANYSLLAHSHAVGRVMQQIGQTQGQSESRVMLGFVAGIFHDTGKLNEACHIYRLNRVLTPAERMIIDTHADISGLYVLRKMSDVRPEDRAFLADVHVIVTNHHTPWMIGDPTLRRIGYELNFVDILISRMEDRHRPGLSQFQAIEVLRQVAEVARTDIAQAHCKADISASFAIIEQLFGVNLEELTKANLQPGVHK